jgi:hypothetical protein
LLLSLVLLLELTAELMVVLQLAQHPVKLVVVLQLALLLLV